MGHYASEVNYDKWNEWRLEIERQKNVRVRECIRLRKERNMAEEDKGKPDEVETPIQDVDVEPDTKPQDEE